jgi:hypothetical protein
MQAEHQVQSWLESTSACSCDPLATLLRNSQLLQQQQVQPASPASLLTPIVPTPAEQTATNAETTNSSTPAATTATAARAAATRTPPKATFVSTLWIHAWQRFAQGGYFTRRWLCSCNAADVSKIDIFLIIYHMISSIFGKNDESAASPHCYLQPA